MTRHRLVWSILAGLGAFALLRGPSGAVAGAVLGVGCWLVISRAEPAHQRAEREQLQRDLPHVVRLLAAALAAGASPVTALAAIAQAMPGVVERRLARVVAQLRLGADPAEVWRDLAAEPALAPLGRSLARAHLTGAPVAIAVERLAEDLARSARADVEDRARAVGVRAAVPLGLCLLPAFVLIGIVPLVAGLFSQFSF
ncbi:type II secretion system F family protein [Nocardioides insulae]|uniref:type II secretion system F family protein n=1 Tax=Nocardioides insulae TaxID=394734 RepID=UPI00055F8D45|nr:type II secretion system F family protein [Nocardioides insulae]